MQHIEQIFNALAIKTYLILCQEIETQGQSACESVCERGERNLPLSKRFEMLENMSQQYPLLKHAPLLVALTERRNADSEMNLC